ncbi:hypothetical protein Glove_87g35 [Diversispora epigaea]|uniref:Uncharacterized protein n=1 Tax=Diversispora epigaea TaxID=1348612 RepID=A0A397J673_9GLOM|nr:hypothetical protein Glove_87g35 [Diversispora epigaea]
MCQQQQQQRKTAANTATAETKYSTRTPSTASTSTTRTLSTTETQRKEINEVENILEPENDEIIGSNGADNPLKLDKTRIFRIANTEVSILHESQGIVEVVIVCDGKFDGISGWLSKNEIAVKISLFIHFILWLHTTSSRW